MTSPGNACTLLARKARQLPRHIFLIAATFAVVLITPGADAATHGPASLKSAGNAGQRIAHADAEPQNWLSTGRTYSEAHDSPLTTIDTQNVSRLGLAWSFDLDTHRGQESTPLAVDGVLYTTSAWSKVQAFDAASGTLLWHFDPKVPGATAVKACCDVVNRGAAFWDGKIYVGTLDGRLIALNAKTGKPLWSVNTVDRTKGYTITGAPRVVRGNVLIGNGGAEQGVRGYITAYDASTGRLKWRFYTVPGEPGKMDNAASDKILAQLAERTWDGNWWSSSGGGGGGTVWDSMSYDPELDLLYIGVGNSAYWNRKYRSANRGDNLFVASIVALRPSTGEYVWHYQQTPGDQWDFTSTQNMILADLTIDGRLRKVLLQAPKNGIFYILDRATGEFLSGTPFVKINWMSGFDSQHRPIMNPKSDYGSTGEVWIGTPSQSGSHSWQPMAMNKQTGLTYIPVQDNVSIFLSDPEFKPKPLGVNVGIVTDPVKLPLTPDVLAAIKFQPTSYLLAWNPITKTEAWRAATPSVVNGGVLTTAGGLVFQGTIDGDLIAYDAVNGAKLWSFNCGSAILAAPISFAVNGRQYISLVVGWGGIYSMLGGPPAWGKTGPRTNTSRVLTFTLDGKAALPAPPEDSTPRRTAVPPAQFADVSTITMGQTAYHRTCLVCHGIATISAGGAPDLRHSATLVDGSLWRSIVADGALVNNGMVGFRENFSLREIDAIRAYVIEQARLEAGENPTVH